MSTDRLLERFVRYCKIHTTSDEDSPTTPSTRWQIDLAKLLRAELDEMGLTARLDEHGYVYAILPENLPDDHPAKGKVPAIGFIAHMDTSPDAPGKDVEPQVHRNYQGGEITLPGDPPQVLSPQDTPQLKDHIGDDIITSDGTTLLGADDKAGVAEIMEAVERMIGDPSILHGPICIGFTPDEEVGRGADQFDVDGFGARIAYTMDGGELGKIEKETFNAHSATFKLKGYNVHPGQAKDKMVNTLYAAAEIIRRLPEDARPETTEGRQGYLHPRLINGSVDACTIHLLVRDFDIDASAKKILLLERIVDEVRARFPKTEIELEVKERYLNMGPKVDENPRIVEIALEAARRAGIEPKPSVIRGGTDGARLSYMGILTPNIFTGGVNYHSVREWVPLQAMEKATQVIVEIAKLWVEEGT
ncbi:MAG: peptidase T [Candidatus Eisenbacteria bacterium]|nr:peptidase T [Candidatus Eisenbacteria bacterium]